MRPVWGQNASGGRRIVSETTIYSQIPASVQPRTASNVMVFAQFNEIITHVVLTGADISGTLDGDVVVWNGKTLIISGVMDSLSFHVIWEVPCYLYAD